MRCEQSEIAYNHYENYTKQLSSVLASVDPKVMDKFMAALETARLSGKRIFFIGNGGSASTASHFANDLSIGAWVHEVPFKAVSLNDNVSVLTAIANDYGYEYVFSKQLPLLAEEDDLLVVISASGNSLNLINAVEVGRKLGMMVIALTGFDGGKLKELVDLPIHFSTPIGEYGLSEDAHLVFNHFVASYVKSRVTRSDER